MATPTRRTYTPTHSSRARVRASANNAWTALEGDSEFSITSVEQDQSDPLELSGEMQATPVPDDEQWVPPHGSFWKTLRRVFGR